MIRGIIHSSFRDPSGFLFQSGGALFRQINNKYRKDYEMLMGSNLYEDLIAEGLMVPHDDADLALRKTDDAFRIIKPERISFISYPYEWCFSALKDAALLTLNVQKEALAHGMSLKDASAFNVQFKGGKPVFIDTLSFEEYREGQPWVAYKQFCMHFLAPLALMSYKDVHLNAWFRVFLDGLPLDLTSKLLPFRTRLRFSLLSHIHMHARSQQRYAEKVVDMSGRKFSRLAMQAIVDSLESAVKALKWSPGGTEWADYYFYTNYSQEGMIHKKEIISEFLEEINPRTLWDLGANDGVFSRIASSRGIQTVSFDIDPACVEANYLKMRRENETRLLPLLYDAMNPTPDLGWANNERMSIISRGPCDTVMALALVHHLAISNNVPLCNIAEYLSKLCKSLIIEFVPKKDSQVQKLLATREDIFPHYDQKHFEADFNGYFQIIKSNKICDSERVVYLMKTRDASIAAESNEVANGLKMQDTVRDFIQVCSRIIDMPERICEIGFSQVKGQASRADLREFFPGKNYIKYDTRSVSGVNLSRDVENLPFEDESMGSIVVAGALGRMLHSPKAFSEIHRVLHPEGVLLIAITTSLQYERDQKRCTSEVVWRLLGRFRTKIVFYHGEEKSPHTIYAVASKKLIQPKLAGKIVDTVRTVRVDSAVSPNTLDKFCELPEQVDAPQLFDSVPLLMEGKLADCLAEADMATGRDIFEPEEERAGVLSGSSAIIARSKKPKVVLICPSFMRFPDRQVTQDRVIIHGLGLMISYAREKGHNFELIDNRMLNGWDMFRDRLADSGAEIVGISALTVNYPDAKRCISIVKEVLPNAKIIVGGPHSSLATGDVADFQDIDHIIKGDGELTFVDVVDAIAAGRKPRRILYGRKPELDRLPFVDRDIFEGNEHLMPPLWFGKTPWVSMITSRGCMFNCSFCAPTARIIFGRTVRRRSPANVIEELQLLRDKYGFKHIRFYDDNIIESPRWVTAFCELYRRNDFTATFGLAGRADLICRNANLITQLANVGLCELNVGFESGSQRILDLLNKRTTVEQNIKSAQILKDHGVKVIAGIMLGMPGETNDEIRQTVELIDMIQPDWVDPSYFTPYPGTTIHEYCKKKGLILMPDNESYLRDFGGSPKIKGVDYGYAIKALGRRHGLREDWCGI